MRHSFCPASHPVRTPNPLFTLLCPLFSALWAQIERELRNGPLVTARAAVVGPRAWGNLAIALPPLSLSRIYLTHSYRKKGTLFYGGRGRDVSLIMIPLIEASHLPLIG